MSEDIPLCRKKQITLYPLHSKLARKRFCANFLSYSSTPQLFILYSSRGFSMLCKAEIRRRKQQSARDKTKHREEQEERERRLLQSARDRARHRAEQVRFHWIPTPPLPPPSPPLTLEQTMAPILESMDPSLEEIKVPKV